MRLKPSGKSLKRILSTGILAIVTAIITISTITIGWTFVRNQYADPLITESIWPIAVFTVIAGATILALFILMITLGFVNEIEPPQIAHYNEYSIIGISGLIAIILTAFATITATVGVTTVGPELTNTADAAAITAITTPLAATYFHYIRPTTGKSSVTETHTHALDPEFVTDDIPARTSSRSLAEREEQSQSTQDRIHTAESTHQEDTTTGDDGEEYESDSETVIDEVSTEFQWVSETDVSFANIGGMEDLKTELQQDVLMPLTESPEKAEELGVDAPNIVFHGPPGTGKTYMAKALATELNMPFAKLSGANVQSKWINESAERVNTLFEEATKIASKAGGAVVFIDELDSVLKDRSGGSNTHEEDMKVVNEFLNHLEETGDNNVVFIGATNRLDALDEAGIRSGRIDKKVKIGKPDTEARAAILKAQLDERPHSLDEAEIRCVAEELDGVVASDIELLVKEAAKKVLVSESDCITFEFIKDSIDSIN